MPSPYVQLLLVNMLLASLTVIIVLGAPTAPAIAGALYGGAVLYARDRRGRRAAASASSRVDGKGLQAGATSPNPLRAR